MTFWIILFSIVAVIALREIFIRLFSGTRR